MPAETAATLKSCHGPLGRGRHTLKPDGLHHRMHRSAALKLSVDVLIHQATYPGLALGLGDRLRKNVTDASARQQSTQVAACGLPPGWTVERLGGLGIEWKGETSTVVSIRVSSSSTYSATRRAAHTASTILLGRHPHIRRAMSFSSAPTALA
ncbi:MAG: hypothetical protein QOH05_1069 [Acetobacteraceae bacterium]|jgi:hypothetical protein|nr:hypothetical protein [Acetobacteraceae bacterium]